MFLKRLFGGLCVNASGTRLLLIAFLGAVMGAGCFAQTFSSTVRGTVSDPSGRSVPGATVEIKNSATNEVRRTTTAADGSYQFTNLLPGTYELTATGQGFKTFVRGNMVLQAGVATDVPIQLELGAIEQKVEVTTQVLMLDTETADHTATLNSNLVSNLPTNTLSPLNFVFALAGTTEGRDMTNPAGTLDQNFSMFGMNGSRTGENEILLDGMPDTAVDWGGLLVSPTIDSVQEMQVIRNTYDARYGKSGGGVVELVTKGGGNQFHGTAYEFFQNDELNANLWSNNRGGTPRGEFKENQFGGVLSGPILKNKLFFLGAYEGLRQPQTLSSGFLSVPTAAERAGDFSQSLTTNGQPQIIYNPFTTVAVPDPNNPGQTIYTRQPFPGNKIPSNLLNPVGQKIASLFPLPNRPAEGPNDLNNYYAQGKGDITNDKFEARGDYIQSDKNRFFVRWAQRVRQSNSPPCFYCNGADTNYAYLNPGYQGTINDTFTPGPTWVFNIIAGGGRWLERQIAASYGILTPGDLGLTPSDFQGVTMPAVEFDRYAALGASTSGNVGLRDLIRYTYSAQINAAKEFTRHSLRFGFEFDDQQINNISRNSGSLSFNSGFTSCDAAGGGVCAASATSSTTSGNAIASLLLGVGGGSAPLNPDIAMALHSYAGFVQDSWRVTPKLTMNLGLRYENQRPATERFNRLAYFNQNVTNPLDATIGPALGRPIKGGLEYASSSNRYGWPSDNKTFAPRIGLAYKLTSKLVARAGFGIFFMPTSAMISYDSPGQFYGFSSNTEWVGSQGGAGFVPTNTLSNPYPTGMNPATGSSQGLLSGIGQALGQAWPLAPHPVPRKYHFSVDMQYQLGRGSVLEVGYTGWRARKMLYGNPDINANQLPTQDLALGSQLDQPVANPFFGVITSGPLADPTIPYQRLLRPFPQFDSVSWTRSLPGAIANYNALNVKFAHQFGAGLTLLSTYQYSKTYDNGSEDYIGWVMGSSWRDSYNTRLDYSISAHDIPHSFVTSLVYDLPVGRHRAFGAGMPGPVNAVVGGWQVASIVRLTSGQPVMPVVMQANPLSQYGFPGPGRPNLVGDPMPSNRNTNEWINPAAFVAPAAFTYGNAPRFNNSIRERKTENVDFSLAKNFQAEAFRVTFRADFLNLFNTPRYGGGDQWGSNIGNCLDCGGFGTVYGTSNLPRNIQLGLKINFDDD